MHTYCLSRAVWAQCSLLAGRAQGGLPHTVTAADCTTIVSQKVRQCCSPVHPDCCLYPSNLPPPLPLAAEKVSLSVLDVQDLLHKQKVRGQWT